MVQPSEHSFRKQNTNTKKIATVPTQRAEAQKGKQKTNTEIKHFALKQLTDSFPQDFSFTLQMKKLPPIFHQACTLLSSQQRHIVEFTSMGAIKPAAPPP
jgi:hypothetical protein